MPVIIKPNRLKLSLTKKIGTGTRPLVKAKKPVVLLNAPKTAIELFRELDDQRVFIAASVTEAIEHCRTLMASS